MKKSNMVEEYRVGNYVINGKSGSFGVVVSMVGGIGEKGVVILVGDYFHDGYTEFVKDEDIRPIPLTEELLEYALSNVFQRADSYNEYDPTEFEIPREVLPGIYGTSNWSLVEDEEEQGKWWISAGTGSLLTMVRGLHHLQNLFYDLEGEELTIDKDQVVRILNKNKRDEKE